MEDKEGKGRRKMGRWKGMFVGGVGWRGRAGGEEGARRGLLTILSIIEHSKDG